MPTFTFRLEPVLDHRKRLEDQQHVVFAAALAVLVAAETQRDDYVARRAAMRERLRTEHGKMDVVELRAAYAHCDFLDRSIVAQEVVIGQARVRVDRERVILVGRTRDKKVLEVLRERRRETFEAEVSAAEQQESDEINARRYDRATTTWENPS
jgi:flagellar export protein FliJ